VRNPYRCKLHLLSQRMSPEPKDWCASAELPVQCSPHGLRKAAGRRLAEAGCTPHQIAAILGHKTLAEVMRYTRSAEQKKMAQEAMDKFE
ncbi:tyrosine-type recombinase/integrase, partial [Acetobacter sp. DsW_059]|uniref:tyrosine-type recombinase/integrase n=1 Tax=Acetobacter sp. DsW_059 TaxID=1670661 RepID=UPI001177BA97